MKFFERFVPKKPKKSQEAIELEIAFDKLFEPEIRGEMKRDSGMLQVEFDIVRNKNPKDSIDQIIKKIYERADKRGRAKIVLGIEITKELYLQLSSKGGRLGAKKEFYDLIIKSLKQKSPVLIERIPEEPLYVLEESEYQNILSEVENFDVRNLWIFIFDNSAEDLINPGNLDLVYSHMG